MAQTFFFYDLETSGLSGRKDRIMQFAGQRTDMDLNPIDEPVNILVKLTDDTVPSPEALLVTHITPQQTLTDGIITAVYHIKLANPDAKLLGELKLLTVSADGFTKPADIQSYQQDEDNVVGS